MSSQLAMQQTAALYKSNAGGVTRMEVEKDGRCVVNGRFDSFAVSAFPYPVGFGFKSSQQVDIPS